MPTVILRCKGVNFDPESLKQKSFLYCDIHRRGEVTRKGIPYEHSGFQVDIGPVDSDDLRDQIELSKRFLAEYATEIKSLKGLDSLVLDYGYHRRMNKEGEPLFCQVDCFDLELLRLCVDLRISIALSLYIDADNDNEDDGRR